MKRRFGDLAEAVGTRYFSAGLLLFPLRGRWIVHSRAPRLISVLDRARAPARERDMLDEIVIRPETNWCVPALNLTGEKILRCSALNFFESFRVNIQEKYIVKVLL